LLHKKTISRLGFSCTITQVKPKQPSWIFSVAVVFFKKIWWSGKLSVNLQINSFKNKKYHVDSSDC
jgi:hypothetical protein